MDLTAICITTSCHHRLTKMLQTVGQLDARPKGYFQRKILSVDDIGEGIPEWIQQDLAESGWEIFTKCFRNLTANVKRALDLVETDWVYYTEDDAWHWEEYPNRSYLDELERSPYGFDRQLGIIGFLEGGYDFESQRAINHLKDRTNYRPVPGGNEACIYLSNPDIHRDDTYPGNNGWIQFPVSILRTSAFRETFEYAQRNFKGVQIESALTMAWNKLNMNDRFAKVGYIRYPEFTKIRLGVEYARERGERNMLFRNFREFRLGVPGHFHFA